MAVHFPMARKIGIVQRKINEEITLTLRCRRDYGAPAQTMFTVALQKTQKILSNKDSKFARPERKMQDEHLQFFVREVNATTNW